MHTTILDLIQLAEISCLGACFTTGLVRAMSTAKIRVTADYIIQPKLNLLILASERYQARLKTLVKYATQFFDSQYNVYKRRDCVLWSSKPVKQRKSVIDTIINTPEESFILLTYNASELLDYLSDNHLPDNVSVIGILPLRDFPIYACDDAITSFPIILAPELIDQSVSKMPRIASRKITDQVLPQSMATQLTTFRALRNTQFEVSQTMIDRATKFFNDIAQSDYSPFTFQLILSSHKRLLFTLAVVNSINCITDKENQEAFDLAVANTACQQYFDVIQHLAAVYTFTQTSLAQAERLMGYILHSGELSSPFTSQQFIDYTQRLFECNNAAFARYILHVLMSHNWVQVLPDKADMYFINPKISELSLDQLINDDKNQ